MTLEHLAHHIPVSFAPISGVLHLTIAVAGQSNYCVDASFLRIRIGHENSQHGVTGADALFVG